MQLINAPAKLTLPFASAGAKNAIPVASQIGIINGAASKTDGFPPLTRTPVSAGGVPPSGQDMNGILYELSQLIRWANAGGGYPFDATFAADTNVGGYPKGAKVLRSDGLGYWFNTTDNNVTDPEGGSAAGWVPDFTQGVTAVTMTSANVTLTALQYGKPIIVISGTLTANVNLIFPTTPAQWRVINNTTGAYSITCKTAGGTGVVVTTVRAIVGDGTNILTDGSLSVNFKQIQPVSASVAANALTLTLNPTALDFRSATLTDGTVNTRSIGAAISLIVSSGSTLGTIAATAARLALLAIDNAGTVELAVVNLAGGNNLDETTLISTTAEGGAGAADSASVIYSTAARTNVPFRVVGFIDITEATAGTWATAPTTVQGEGGQALAALQSIGYGQTWQDVTGSRSLGTTYTNTTGRPIFVSVVSGLPNNTAIALTVNGAMRAQSGNLAASTAAGCAAGIVMPGNTYSVTGGTLQAWNEIR